MDSGGEGNLGLRWPAGTTPGAWDSISPHTPNGRRTGVGGRGRGKDGCRVDGFEILVDSRVAAVQFTPAGRSRRDQPGFLGNVADDFLPGSVGGGVQIDPGDESIPRFRVQAHAVVSVAQNLDQFARVGVKIPRSQHVRIAFQCGGVDESTQRHVRRGEVHLESRRNVFGRPGCQIECGQPVFQRPAMVAPDTVGVQHRLDFAYEREPPRRAVPWLDLRGRSRHGHRMRPDRRSGVLRLVTTDTGDNLAGHGRKPATHQRQSLAFLVQGVNRDRRARGHLKMGGPVRFHGHCPEDASHVPGAGETDSVRSPPIRDT